MSFRSITLVKSPLFRDKGVVKGEADRSEAHR